MKGKTEIVDIKVGFTCNNNCRFCAQAHNRKFGDKTTEQIKEDMLAAKRDCCQGIVLTGGEVTIRKDVLELVRFAKELGFKRIQIQTNGRMFYYKDFCTKIIEAGANDFAPAIHGHIPELHDYLTRSPGSFKQTYTGIKNLIELGYAVGTNTVVVKPNYRYLPEIARMLVKVGVSQFQLAFVHAAGNAWENFDQMIPYASLAAPYMKKALQIGIDAGVRVMTEAMPYCLMEGYEEYVAELVIPQAEVREVAHFIKNFERVRKEELKMKFPKCRECKYYLICEGPWKEYPQRKGITEFKPVPGTKIKSKEELLKKLSDNGFIC